MTRSGVVRKAIRRVPPLSGRAVRMLLACAFVALGPSGCLYGFSGGGGLAKHLRTVAIQPFDNQTAVPEIQRELLDQLRRGMRDRLNLREATEAKADVVVRGTITRYEVDLPAGVSADPRQTTSTRRRLQVSIDVEIVDQTTGTTIFKRPGVSREGQYAEGGELVGRRNAIETIVNDIVDGMTSRW